MRKVNLGTLTDMLSWHKKLATQWIQSYPCRTTTSQETGKSLQKFLEPSQKPTVIYTDNSIEFGKSCEKLAWNHRSSTPHRSETNGVAERAVRSKKGNISRVVTIWLRRKKWADSLECHCYLRNVEDLLADGKTPYERRFGEFFKGPIIPFGAMVEYFPISARDRPRIQQFGEKVLPGIFLGYALISGGIWEGNILIADIEDMENSDASEIYPRRLKAKEVLITQRKREIVFRVADGTAKLSERDYEF